MFSDFTASANDPASSLPRIKTVDDLNGFVATVAKRLGMRAPVNEAIVELAHRVEMGVLNATPENLRLLADLASARSR